MPSRREFLKLAALFTAAGSLPLLQACGQRAAQNPDAPLKIGYLPITDATPLLVAQPAMPTLTRSQATTSQRRSTRSPFMRFGEGGNECSTSSETGALERRTENRPNNTQIRRKRQCD